MAKEQVYQNGFELVNLWYNYGPTLERAYSLRSTSRQEKPKTPLDVVDKKNDGPKDIIVAEGPQGGQYTLTVDHAAREVIHAHGPPSQQQADGPVKELDITYTAHETICHF